MTATGNSHTPTEQPQQGQAAQQQPAYVTPQPMYAAAPGYAAQPKQENGMAITSMVLGIISAVFAFIFFPIGFVVGAVGLPFAFVAKNKGQSKGMWVTGLVTSIAGLALSLLFFLLVVILPLVILGGLGTAVINS